MTDDELIDGFEQCSLVDFHHRDHVRLVWLYLTRDSLLDVLAQFPGALKRFAASKGKPNLYHQTITWAYVLLIHDRIVRSGHARWDEFAAGNSDLLEWPNSILATYYTTETLRSELARRAFIFPDKTVVGSTPEQQSGRQ